MVKDHGHLRFHVADSDPHPRPARLYLRTLPPSGEFVPSLCASFQLEVALGMAISANKLSRYSIDHPKIRYNIFTINLPKRMDKAKRSLLSSRNYLTWIVIPK
jgi:hypothetical protein